VDEELYDKAILLWNNPDEFHRHYETIAGMSAAVPASSNVLLDYGSCMPIVVTLSCRLKSLARHNIFSAFAPSRSSSYHVSRCIRWCTIRWCTRRNRRYSTYLIG